MTEAMSAKRRKLTKFSFTNTENWTTGGFNFLDFSLTAAIEIKSHYQHALRHLFNEVHLKRLLEILSLLLKVQKSKASLGKIWQRLKGLENLHPGVYKLLNKMFAVSRDFFDSITHYITFVVVEPQIKMLFKTLVSVKTFQQTFRAFKEFLVTVSAQLFISTEGLPTFRQLMNMGKLVVNFYKIVS